MKINEKKDLLPEGPFKNYLLMIQEDISNKNKKSAVKTCFDENGEKIRVI